LATTEYPTLDDVEAYWSKAVGEVPSHGEAPKDLGHEFREDQPYERHSWGTWLEFKGLDGLPFWCYWQTCSRPGKRKTLVHLPGYGTETSMHPSLVHAGYNVLHVNPRGYCGPNGFSNLDWRAPDGSADVLLRNIDTPDSYGYRSWFQDVVIAVRWLQSRDDVAGKLGFFGTSQGGGGALISGSILAYEGIVGAVAADEPFLTNFRLLHETRVGTAYDVFFSNLPQEKEAFRRAFYTLGLIDAAVHAPKMTYPVLLTAGSADPSCPTESIHSLYDLLPDTRAIVEMHNEEHGYTPPFPTLAEAWFDLYL